jgi:NAD(P)-dependent dehydrogenase (short-subunit alcohol dehydrogenase family)
MRTHPRTAAAAKPTVADPRTVVITGASRGLGLATAAHLHRAGWRVVAAMRSPDVGLDCLCAATRAGADDPRLIGVRLDLDDPASIASAARVIRDRVGPPDGLVHNAGVASVGCLEELPTSVWQQVFSTNFFGPVQLTKELLPDMRAAGRGRIVVVSSHGAIRGMPGIGPYSASKGALERWGESLSQEIAPFGLGVTVLVAGTFKTDILTLTHTYADPTGPYANLHDGLETAGRRFLRFAGAPERFAPAVEKALGEHQPFARHGVGIDARLLLAANRLMPYGVLQRIMARAIGIPRAGSLRGDPRRTATVTAHSDERKVIG